MPIYIEHDYYPMDVLTEFKPSDPNRHIPQEQMPAPRTQLVGEKKELQLISAESMEAA